MRSVLFWYRSFSCQLRRVSDHKLCVLWCSGCRVRLRFGRLIRLIRFCSFCVVHVLGLRRICFTCCWVTIGLIRYYYDSFVIHFECTLIIAFFETLVAFNFPVLSCGFCVYRLWFRFLFFVLVLFWSIISWTLLLLLLVLLLITLILLLLVIIGCDGVHEATV